MHIETLELSYATDDRLNLKTFLFSLLGPCLSKGLNILYVRYFPKVFQGFPVLLVLIHALTFIVFKSFCIIDGECYLFCLV